MCKGVPEMHLIRCFVILALCLCPMLASADPVPLAGTPLDLTALGTSGFVNGTLFEVQKAGGTGSGNLPALVRLKGQFETPTIISRGHNTSYGVNPYFDVNSKRNDFQIQDLPIVGRDGLAYFEFLLDFNEPKGGLQEFLSLEEVKISTHTDPGLFVTTTTYPAAPDLSPLGTPRYDLDGAGDAVVLMDASVVSGGQGNMDIRMLVPVNVLLGPGAEPDHYVYMWSLFGSEEQYASEITVGNGPTAAQVTVPHGGWVQDAGFEEWAYNAEITPTISGGDWGDLPETATADFPGADFPTTDAGNTLGETGAVHKWGLQEWLGPGRWQRVDPDDVNSALFNPSWDNEDDGQPTDEAYGDDVAGYDDEDGVEYFAGAGDTVDVTMSVSDWEDTVRYHGAGLDEFGRDGLLHLDAWWDKDGSGTFEEGTEHVVSETYDPNSWGQNTTTVPITISGYAPSSQAPFLRWRLNYGRPNLYWGESTFGEVEDYYITPEPASALLLGVPLAVLARYRRRRKK